MHTIQTNIYIILIKHHQWQRHKLTTGHTHIINQHNLNQYGNNTTHIYNIYLCLCVLCVIVLCVVIIIWLCWMSFVVFVVSCSACVCVVSFVCVCYICICRMCLWVVLCFDLCLSLMLLCVIGVWFFIYRRYHYHV